MSIMTNYHLQQKSNNFVNFWVVDVLLSTIARAATGNER